MKTFALDFAKYISLNVLCMIGLSCYILADTFFIAKALGPLGIAALNFSISVYSIIAGVGLLVGIGGGARYAILQSQKKHEEANRVFTSAVVLGAVLGAGLFVVGVFGTRQLAVLLGADADVFPMTETYLRTILVFAPAFIANNILLAFVRNDENPRLPMIAMLTGSASNVVLDYVFMFPLQMGMFGAAFATCLAPLISISILAVHFAKRKNGFRLVKTKFKPAEFFTIARLGASSFVGEISSAVTLMVFNLAIVNLEGNTGVAAYGIVANLALIATAIFTGLAQGVQPLFSRAHGKGRPEDASSLLKMATLTSIFIGLVIYLLVFFGAEGIVSVFNGEGSVEIASLANRGLRIYFTGFLFAGLNIAFAQYLSAVERSRPAFAVSLLRGCVLLIPAVLLLSRILQMAGIWLSFVVTELAVLMYARHIWRKKPGSAREEGRFLQRAA